MKRTASVTALLAILLGCGQSELPPQSIVEPNQTNSTESETDMTHPELEFFNSLSGELKVTLSAPTEKIGSSANVRATPEAEIESLELAAEVFHRDSGTFRALTPDELRSVAFRASQITLQGEGGGTVTHQAPNGKFFTVQELLKAVAETERQTRDKSEWFGGVDVHHVFFEGIHQGDDGVWKIYWGS
jgi:hypothetical protein